MPTPNRPTDELLDVIKGQMEAWLGGLAHKRTATLVPFSSHAVRDETSQIRFSGSGPCRIPQSFLTTLLAQIDRCPDPLRASKIPPPDPNTASCDYVYYCGVPIRIILTYHHLENEFRISASMVCFDQAAIDFARSILGV